MNAVLDHCVEGLRMLDTLYAQCGATETVWRSSISSLIRLQALSVKSICGQYPGVSNASGSTLTKPKRSLFTSLFLSLSSLQHVCRDTEVRLQATDEDEHILSMVSHESHLEWEGVVRKAREGRETRGQ